MLDIVSIGTATQDVFVHIPHGFSKESACVFYPGSKVDITAMEYFTGGGASNTAVGFARLGLKAGVLCALGIDNSGKAVLEEFKKEKVDSRLCMKVKGKNTAYSVVLTGFGVDRIVLCYAGATAMLGHAQIDWKKLKAKWFYVSSVHAGKRPKMLEKTFLHARKINAKIAFNPGQKELELGIDGLKKVFGEKKIGVLIVNNEEALKLTGSGDIKRNLSKLGELAEIVAITEGKAGCHATDGRKIYSMDAIECKPVDVTGAGDAFSSGFVGALVKGKSIEDALLWGSANAHSVIMHLGTKNILLKNSQMTNYLAKHKGLKVHKENF